MWTRHLMADAETPIKLSPPTFAALEGVLSVCTSMGKRGTMATRALASSCRLVSRHSPPRRWTACVSFRPVAASA